MLIDLLLLASWSIAILKGMSRGFVVAVFSVIGFIVGLAAALALSSKLSQQIATEGGKYRYWIPFLSFLAVFLIASLLVSLLARMVQKLIKLSMLEGLNKIGGAILYVAVYSVILSALIFFLEAMHIVSEENIQRSAFLPFIKPLAPSVIEGIGKFIPAFRNMFTELQTFFETSANNLYH